MYNDKRWCKECNFFFYDLHHHLDDPKPPSRDRFGDAFLSHTARPRKPSLVLLTFEALHVAGLSSCAVTVFPQVVFRPKRLIVPPELGPWFMLGDLKIGNSSQFAACGNVAMSVFPPVPEKDFPIDNLAGIPTVQIGQYISLLITNRGNSAMDFSALMYGETIS